MRFTPKLALVLALASVAPLVVVTLVTLPRNRAALRAQLDEVYAESARSQAEGVDRALRDKIEALVLVTSALQLAEFEAEEREQTLRLIYRQTKDASIVGLFDAAGSSVTPPVHLGQVSSGHEGVDARGLEAFASNVPLAAALGGKVAVGPVYVVPDAAAAPIPRAVIAVPVPGAAGATWVLAVELSLREVAERFAAFRVGEAGRAFLLDGAGRVIAHAEPVRVAAREDLSSRIAADEQWLRASAKVPLVGWLAVVEQPAAEALAPISVLTQSTVGVLGAALVLAAIAAVLLARALARPVATLAEGTRALAAGQLSHRIQLNRKDELQDLAQAFNSMGEALEAATRRLLSFNEELKKQVDERTRDLKQTQEQLVQSQKIAAVTGLAAGIAHEINNPLAGVIGITQVMLRRAQTDPEMAQNLALLADVEKESLRIKGIVATLVNLGQDYTGRGFSSLDVNDVLDASLAVADAEARGAGIEIVREYRRPLPAVLGNRQQLQQVILHIFSNARQAMSGKPGRLTVTTGSDDARLVKVSLKDTGKGIAAEHLDKIFEPFFTTKDNWRGEGLGLTIAFRIVEEHGGTIRAESTVGQGTTLIITLPAERDAHLG